MTGKHISSVLVLSLLSQVACIHTKSEEHSRVEVAEVANSTLTRVASDTLHIESLIYTPSRYPLEDFFSRLAAGEFKNAFQRINLSYEPAKTDNAAIQELLDAGFVPVYLQIRNESQNDIPVGETQFKLSDGVKSFKAVPAKKLPTEFQHFSPAAVGANVYNTGVVVIGIAAIVGLLVLSGASGAPMHMPVSSRSDDEKGKEIFNKTTKTTKVHYSDYLITARTLAPGQTTQGLVFFHATSPIDYASLKVSRVK